MSDFVVGADPEFFLKNSKTGKFVAAAGLFPGTKEEPFELEDGAMQVDGLALEFNIHPTSNPSVFKKRINNVLAQMREKINDVDPDLEPCFIPFAKFDPTYFEEIPDEHKVLGCEPDFRGDGRINVPPDDLMYRPFRTAAGHIHIGWTEDADPGDVAHFEDAKYIANHFGENPDKDFSTLNGERKKYYGGSCAFRPKSYGVELRSPSNAWVMNDPEEMCGFVLSHMERA